MSDEKAVVEKLLEDVDVNIEIVIENREEILNWGKDLTNLPLFTIREIEKHRQKSGKNNQSIVKTRDRGIKFKEEGYILRDTLFTRTTSLLFYVKAQCRASMKREVRALEIILNKENGQVEQASCNCPAGNSGYCNHVMALLFELADFSLHQIKTVPDDIACTSGSRQWGNSFRQF